MQILLAAVCITLENGNDYALGYGAPEHMFSTAPSAWSERVLEYRLLQTTVALVLSCTAMRRCYRAR